MKPSVDVQLSLQIQHQDWALAYPLQFICNVKAKVCHFLRGSAIAKIVGANAAKYNTFDSTVNMWVFEEMINGRKLTEIINTEHENVKYLPGHKLPPNVVRSKASPKSLNSVIIAIYITTMTSLEICQLYSEAAWEVKINNKLEK